MEIRKGISQMAEYPNARINFVVPSNGNMYYVLKDGELENGAIIATLDPRYAIDPENNESKTIGVFSESGDVLVDFDKKEIIKITDNLVLAKESKPSSNEVLEALVKQNDPTAKASVEDNKTIIIDNLITEMGSSGEMIMSDPYSEANVYSLDSYNNKVGLDCSFIGKNRNGLYFHTSDINSLSKFVVVDEFKKAEEEEIPEVSEDEKSPVEEKETPVEEKEPANDLLDAFNLTEAEFDELPKEEEPKEEDEEVKEVEEVKEDEDIDIETEEDNVVEEKDEEDIYKSFDSDSGVLDNAIDVINKLMNEANKMKDKIKELESKVKEQEELISADENRKDELNDLVGKANELLENVD